MVADFDPAPNPYLASAQGGVNFYFTAGRTVASYTLDVYTDSFRLVKRLQDSGVSLVGRCHINLPDYDAARLAAGTYYCVLRAHDNSGREESSIITVLIILR